MGTSGQVVRVLVSSTSKDLEDYRAVARLAILDLRWLPDMMEHFLDGEPEGTVDACRKHVEKCDLLLLIVGWKRGTVPTVEQGGNGRDSFTALELACAREKAIPVAVLCASDKWPVNLSEDDEEPRRWVKEFRKNLNQIAVPFDHEDPAASEKESLPGFRAKVKQVLLAHKERTLSLRATRQGGAGELDFFPGACGGLLQGADIPVIGNGLYGDGPLSTSALAQALIGHDAASAEFLKESVSLATVAEYIERIDVQRKLFLERFRKALEQQAACVAGVPVLDLIAETESIQLIVSTSYDDLLEKRLVDAKRSPIVISHVLRSAEGEADGMILVLRSGPPFEICRADKVAIELKAGECLIYKPFGSPLLHRRVDSEREIDTAVVTETDHATLLQRLKSPETGVPAPLARRIRRSPLLFLGYSLDAWQYRLMMAVFQSTGRGARPDSTLAVRVPESAIEEAAWSRLGANLIRMSPDEFARRVKDIHSERQSSSA